MDECSLVLPTPVFSNVFLLFCFRECSVYLNYKVNMAVKHTTVQPFSGLYDDEASLPAELKTFLNSSDTRNLLRELIFDDQLAQIGMINEVGSPQATGREALVPQPIEGHHLKGQRPESETTHSAIVVPSTPIEATSSACQGVSLLDISNEDRHLFAGKAENSRVVTTKQFSPRPVPTFYQCQPKKKFPAARKKKTVFTDYQMELLEMTFSNSQYPSSVLRQQLSYISGISPQIILTWFQNRRVRYRHKEDQKTSKRHSSSIASVKPYTFVKSTSASDDNNKSKLPAFTHDECSIPHLKPARWSTHPAAQSVDAAFPSPDHMLNDGQPQTANLQQQSNHVYATSQPESRLDFTLTNNHQTQHHSAQHHHTKPWYSTLDSQRMSQCIIRHQSNQTDGQLHQMPSSADWPNKNCASVSYQQLNTQFCCRNHGSSLHPTSHSTQEPNNFEENLNPPQGYPYQYFPLRYPGTSQTSIHNWNMINQHSMPSYHQQQVIPLSATFQTPPETQLLHMSYDNHNVFSSVGRPLGNQPDIIDVTQSTLPSQHYLHTQDLPTINSKPHQQMFNGYSSLGDGSYSENFQSYPSIDPFNVEVIQREYTATQGSQPLNVPTTQSLLESQTSSSTQVLISDQRQVSTASPAVTECSFASHSLYIDLDVHSDVDYQ